MYGSSQCVSLICPSLKAAAMLWTPIVRVLYMLLRVIAALVCSLAYKWIALRLTAAWSRIDPFLPVA